MTLTQPNLSFESLHALKVKGFCTDDAFVAITGKSPADSAQILQDLVDRGLAKRREGRMAGTALTPGGGEKHAELLGAEQSQENVAAAIDALYNAFLPINGDFKRVCRRWQTRDGGEPNLHDDAGYDAAVVDAAGTLLAAYGAAVEQIEDAPTRFVKYSRRLTEALDRVKAGDSSSFMRPMHESVHDIWMELHQDLLLSAGRQRGEHDEG